MRQSEKTMTELLAPVTLVDRSKPIVRSRPYRQGVPVLSDAMLGPLRYVDDFDVLIDDDEATRTHPLADAYLIHNDAVCLHRDGREAFIRRIHGSRESVILNWALNLPTGPSADELLDLVLKDLVYQHNWIVMIAAQDDDQPPIGLLQLFKEAMALRDALVNLALWEREYADADSAFLASVLDAFCARWELPPAMLD